MLLASPLALPILLVGAFYAFAGVVAARAVQQDAVLDSALTGLSAGRRDALDQERSLWLFAGAAVVGAGGLLLLVGSAMAAPVFLLSCVLQGLHFLVLSPRRYDRDDPVDPAGRRKSLMAFQIYGVATAFVVWAATAGVLRPVGQGSPWPLLMVGLVWLVMVVRGLMLLRGLR